MVTVTKPCGTGASVPLGIVPWNNPTYVQADDSNAAYAVFASSDSTTHYLYAHNFGFAIPANAAISDVSFSYIRKTSTTGVYEQKFVMYDAIGGNGYNNVSDGTWLTTSYVTKTYHGSSEFWGITLIPALVNDVDFGIGITFRKQGNANGYIQYVSCTVTYTLPEVDFSIGSASNSPHAIIDEAVVYSEVKSPQWIRSYYAWTMGKL